MISSLTTMLSRAHYRVAMYLLALLFCSITFGSAGAASLYYLARVEVFTTTELKVVDNLAIGANKSLQTMDLQVYELNGVQLVEAELSKDLPANPNQSKRLAVQHIQVLDGQTRRRMQLSAIGLAKAIHYGIDRFPAVVFDGQTVVYGVTDLSAALAHYQVWRTRVKP
jgi:integrating conjugative element protein (TIGR03757 family)